MSTAYYKNKQILSRSGIVYYILVSVVALMSIFILSYFSYSRQVAHSSFYHVNRERISNITNIILDSAFSDFQNNTKNPESQLSKWIIDEMRIKQLSETSQNLTATIFESNKSEILQGLSLDYDLTGKIFDKRMASSKEEEYYEGEGLATLEIDLKATIRAGKKILAECQRKRHYDVKSVCLISNENSRKNSYTMTFPLDYALLVRNGLEEFNNGGQPGPAYNTGSLKLEIMSQDRIPINKRGLVYFGGANNNSTDQRIFFNTSNTDNPQIVPRVPIARNNITGSELFAIWPELDGIITREVVDGGADSYSGARGYLKFSALPLVTDRPVTDTTERRAREFINASYARNGNISPAKAGISFSFAGNGKENYLKSILRGSITQSYLYIAELGLDASRIRVTGPDPNPLRGTRTEDLPADAKRDLENRSRRPCLSPDLPVLSQNTSPGAAEERIIGNRARQLEQSKNSPLPFTSDMLESYPNYSGKIVNVNQPTEIYGEIPRFFRRNSEELYDITNSESTGPTGFRPFAHYGLYFARYKECIDLEKNGIYDKENGILYLRGIVSVENEAIVLEPPAKGGSIMVKGAGALIAPKGFIINTGIECSMPEDLCILFTRENSITINTPKIIEASLFAFNDSRNSTIHANEPYHIKGAVGVDKLNLSRYPSSWCKIEYDPRLRINSDNDELFTITVSPWIRFEDVNFARN